MQKEVVRKSAIPYYVIGLSWLLYSIVFPLYRLVDFLLIIGISIALFFVAKKVFPSKIILVEVADAPVRSGNAQIDHLILEGKKYLSEIIKANERIEDEVLSDQITIIEDISNNIFEFIIDKPNKAPQIRKFFSYYLPTVHKLLNSYDKLANQSVQGDNIKETMQRIEEIMATVVTAFESQLDSLFQDEALDISTDITVLEGMLAQEGLINRELKNN